MSTFICFLKQLFAPFFIWANKLSIPQLISGPQICVISNRKIKICHDLIMVSRKNKKPKKRQQQAARLFKLLNPTSATQCHFNNLWPRRQRKWQRARERERVREREVEKHKNQVGNFFCSYWSTTRCKCQYKWRKKARERA